MIRTVILAAVGFAAGVLAWAYKKGHGPFRTIPVGTVYSSAGERWRRPSEGSPDQGSAGVEDRPLDAASVDSGR